MQDNVEKNGIKFKMTKKTQVVLYAILAVIVVLLIVFTAAQKFGNVTINTMTASVKSYFMSMGSGDGYPYSLDADSVKKITVNNTNLMLLCDDKTFLLTPTAKEINPVGHKYSNPVMKSSGINVIVYDLDSGKFRIQENSELKFESELKNRIMAGAVGRTGNYALGTYDESVQSLLTVYNSKNKEIYGWNFKSERISDIALSDDGKYAAVTTIYSESGKMSSNVYVFDFKSKDAILKKTYNASVLVNVAYINGDNLVATGDNVRVYITGGKNEKDRKDFGSDILHNYCMSDDGRTAVVLSKFGSSSLSELSVYSNRNKLQFSLDLDKEVKWVACDERYTAVLLENEVRTYDKKGKQIGSIGFSGEPLKVAVDGNKVYVLTSGSLQCYKTKSFQEVK